MYDTVSQLADEINARHRKRIWASWGAVIVFGVWLSAFWFEGLPLVYPFVWLSGCLIGMNHTLAAQNTELAHLLANEIDERNGVNVDQPYFFADAHESARARVPYLFMGPQSGNRKPDGSGPGA